MRPVEIKHVSWLVGSLVVEADISSLSTQVSVTGIHTHIILCMKALLKKEPGESSPNVIIQVNLREF